MSKILCIALVLVVAAVAIRPADKWQMEGSLGPVSSGYPACDPSVKQYSGYFDIDSATNKHYFYWAFESRNDPANDPVLLWMTGGPGCSSGLAAMVENGPCHLDVEGKMYNNPYAWNNNATIIYIDQPAGVGYSYADNSGLDHNETMVGNDMYNFLQAFFTKYSQFQQNEFFVYGESYGGHYAPATAHRVWEGIQKNQGLRINLKGLSVGNGLTAPQIQYNYYSELAYNWCKIVKGKPCISEAEFNDIVAAQPKCISQIKECNKQYTNDTTCEMAQDFCNNNIMGPYMNSGLNPYDIRIKCVVPGLCYNFTSVTNFFNDPSVQQQLGARPGKWASCNMTVNQMFAADWMHSFNQLVPDLLNSDIRVMIYAGDMDYICNWMGNKAWTLALDWSKKTDFNAAGDKPWYVNEVEAGFVRTVPSANGNINMLFSFVQVHGAGHMVPMNQPARALDMVMHFTRDKPWPQ